MYPKSLQESSDSADSYDESDIYRMPMLIVGMEKMTTQAVYNILASSYNGMTYRTLLYKFSFLYYYSSFSSYLCCNFCCHC